MKKFIFLWMIVLFIITSCESNSTETGNTHDENTGVVTPPPPQDTLSAKRAKDSIAYEAKRKQLPAAKVPEKPWKRLLKEYKVLLCRVTKGTANEREKERYKKISGEISALNQRLAGAERFEFMAEHARATDIKNCR